jgi:Carboxypeptidase regulatory-like domain
MNGQKVLRGLAVCMFFLLPAVVLAQVSASVVGTVKDTSGAVVPGATVTVRNLETAETRTVTTNATGYYRVLSLPVGRYEVAAAQSGFKKGIRTGINLVVGQEAVVDFNLEVGEVQQEVTVSAEAPIVNTTTAPTSGLVEEEQVKDLPLNGRSFDNLITLNPGATSTATSMRTSGTGKVPGNLFNIAGQRAESNLFLLNGIEYTSASLFGATPGGASGQLLGIDAVREFNVLANTYGAQYGKRFGGQINVVTQSGTNQFHGTAFEFLRNDILDTWSYFDHQAAASNSNFTKPPYRRNDFGAAAGGPIRRDKTFIFGNYEGIRQRLTQTVKVTVPSQYLIDNTLTSMVPYLALYPAPNGPVLNDVNNCAATNTCLTATAFTPALNPVREDFGTARMDQLFSANDTLSASYTADDGSNTTPGADPTAANILTLRSQVLSLEETHIFSARVVNTLRVGFSRGAYFTDNRPLISLPAIADSTNPSLTCSSLCLIQGLPMGQVLVSGSGVSGGALSPYGSLAVEQDMVRNLFTYSDSLEVIKGRHQISLGAWFQRVQFNGLFISSAYGGVTFSDVTSFFLKGQATSVSGTFPIPPRASRQWEAAWYAADTIKVTPRFTLTLGLRHEFNNGWKVNQGLLTYILGPDGVPLTQPRIGTQMYTRNNAKWLFAPRVGLAWDIFGNGRTAIHAGYGTYYNTIDDLIYAIAQPASFSIGSAASPVQFPVVLSPTESLPQSTPRIRGIFPSDAKTPTVQEWSFSVEQQLSPSTALSVGYVGSHGYHNLGSGEVNPTKSVICPNPACPTGAAALPDGTKYYPSSAQSARLNPALGGSSGVFQSFVNSSYNSLQVDLRQRVLKGLTFRANYSFSKSLDNSSVNLGGIFSNCPSGLEDPQNPSLDYGPTCYDVTQKFAFNGSYDLPFGQGRALGGGASGVANKILGGWKLNGIITVQTGMPFTPVVGLPNSRNGGNGGTDRPSVNPNFSGPVILGTPNQWFDPNAFSLPPAGTYGNLGRDTLRGPGLADVDMSLFKDTRISERTNVEFRAEVFNFFNHANFAEPNNVVFARDPKGKIITSGSAGLISGLLTPQRLIQLGLKLIW